jgi:microcystin-dependent protein
MAQEFIGAIKLFAGNFAISGYSFCDGSTLAIQQNQALFALVGTTYGGNGTTTFQLPDLRGRVPISFGQGSGLTNRTQGQTGGQESVALTASTAPVHNHLFNAATNATTTTTVGPAVLTGSLKVADGAFYTAPNQGGFTPVSMNANSVTPMGGSQPHNNIQPTLAINYLIALFGIFPSQN